MKMALQAGDEKIEAPERSSSSKVFADKQHKLSDGAYSYTLINPAETFGDIVIDYNYVECTSAAIQALVPFRKLYPGHRQTEIDNCIKKAAKFIETIQEADGSWYGSWAVCFTYGTWIGVKGLVATGRNYSNSASICKVCGFLLSKQLASGGWGESYLSCQNKIYSNLPDNRSHVVNTEWSMMALINAGQYYQRSQGNWWSKEEVV